MMRTSAALLQGDVGFNPNNIWVARLPFPRGQYKTAADKERFFSQLLARVKVVPGVVEATETSTVPPYGGIRTEIEIPGKTHGDRWDALYQLVSEGYFRTLGARLMRGRLLTEGEMNDARKVAVGNQKLGEKYFGHENPIGRQIQIPQLGSMPNSPVSKPVFQILGLIVDVHKPGIQEPSRPRI